MGPEILSDVRVVDFTRGLAGPFATQILGDLGADVVKIERPQGGDAQRLDRGASKLGQTPAGYLAYNRNKRSIALDLKTELEAKAALKLAATADVVVHNFRTGVMERLGLDYPTVAAVNPNVIYCAISGFGPEGAMAQKAANDIVVQGWAGMTSLMGLPGQPPVRAHGYPADITTGIYASVGILAALKYRQDTGKGQLVEVTMMGTVLSLLGRVYSEYFADGYVPQPLGSGSDMGAPNGALPTKDGWITISAHGDRHWAATCRALGLEALIEDERFRTREGRRARADEVVAALSAVTTQMTRDEAEAALEREKVSCGQVRTVDEIAGDPRFSDHFIDIPVHGEKDAVTVGSPLRFSATPTTVRRGVSGLGEHGEEILREAGYSESEIDAVIGRDAPDK
jgi:crotonobetainyl-CoA:carnitine CoA-transferase CaiB-like acyl-CoA transferase